MENLKKDLELYIIIQNIYWKNVNKRKIEINIIQINPDLQEEGIQKEKFIH